MQLKEKELAFDIGLSEVEIQELLVNSKHLLCEGTGEGDAG